jgi:hypothetical protein
VLPFTGTWTATGTGTGANAHESDCVDELRHLPPDRGARGLLGRVYQY